MGQMSKSIPLLQAEFDQYTMWAANAAKELAEAKEAAAREAGCYAPKEGIYFDCPARFPWEKYFEVVG